MSTLVRITAVLCAVSYVGLATSCSSHTQPQRTQGERGVFIDVCSLNGETGSPLGPTLLVLVSNRTGGSVVIDRRLSGVPLRQHNSLWASVTDLESGKAVGPRAKFKRLQRMYHESDLVELEPNFSYGTQINLQDYFGLESGKTYSVSFQYQILAPKLIGQLRPWYGVAISKDVRFRT